jgi:photosystem I subunit PsaN
MLAHQLVADPPTAQALNDSKRLATSGANFARSRTVTDGTCAFPNNVRPTTLFASAFSSSSRGRCAAQMVGCENAAESGSVKYLSDDLKLEVRAEM